MTSLVPNLVELPEPDGFGTYRLGKGAFILRVSSKQNKHYASYILSWGKKGMEWNGPDFRYFRTPEEALEVFNGREP